MKIIIKLNLDLFYKIDNQSKSLWFLFSRENLRGSLKIWSYRCGLLSWSIVLGQGQQLQMSRFFVASSSGSDEEQEEEEEIEMQEDETPSQSPQETAAKSKYSAFFDDSWKGTGKRVILSEKATHTCAWTHTCTCYL